LQQSRFSLCPSWPWHKLNPPLGGSSLKLWEEAALFAPETIDGVARLPNQSAGQQPWKRYRHYSSVPDTIKPIEKPILSLQIDPSSASAKLRLKPPQPLQPSHLFSCISPYKKHCP
jgi:hypothetical protein